MRFYDFLKEQYGEEYKFTAAEIGVYEGGGADLLCNSLSFDILYLVDPYLKYDEYTSYSGHSSEYWDGLYDRVKGRFNIGSDGFGQCNDTTVRFYRMMSEEASKEFTDESLDFIYIDGNHDYEYVKKDIEAWYPKIKMGGWVTGHDWPYPGVQKAATEYVQDNGLSFGPGSHMAGYTEWWFKKVR